MLSWSTATGVRRTWFPGGGAASTAEPPSSWRRRTATTAELVSIED